MHTLRARSLAFLVTALLAPVLACGLFKFDLEQPIPEQRVPGSPLGVVAPLGAIFKIPLVLDLEAASKAQGAGPARAARLKTLSFTVTAPSDGTFDFLDEIHISISSEGLPEREIATLVPVPASKTIELQPVNDVDLLPYIKAGASLSAAAKGNAPVQEVKFIGRVVVTIEV